MATWGGGVSVLKGAEWRTITQAQGLPTNSVRAIFVESTSRTWVGTDGGIALIDRSKVIPFKEDRQDLPEDSIFTIFRTPRGKPLFGTAIGNLVTPTILREPAPGEHLTEDDVRWTEVFQNPEGIRHSIRDVLQLPDGTRWLALSEAGYAIVNGASVTYPSRDQPEFPDRIYSFARTSDGRIWAAGGTHAYVYDQGVWSTVPEAGNITTTANVSPEGQLMVGTSMGLRVLSDNGWEDLVLDFEDPSPHIEVIRNAPDGAVWVGTRGGVYRLSKPEWRMFTHSTDGTLLDTNTFRATPESGVFAIDEANRLCRFEDNSFHTLLPLGGDKSILRDMSRPRKSHLWALIGQRVFRVNLDPARIEKEITVPPQIIPSGIYEGPTGTLWLMTQTGIFRLEGDQFLPAQDDPNYTRVQTYCMEELEDGTIWAGFETRVEHWKPDGIVVYPAEGDIFPGLPPVLDISAHENGSVWFTSTSTGLTVLRGGLWDSIGTEDGLGSHRTSCVYESRDDCLWVGYRESGISSFCDGVWLGYQHLEGVPRGKVIRIGEDQQGSIWAAVQGGGIFRFSPSPDAPQTRIVAFPMEISPQGIGVFSFAGLDAWNRTRPEDLLYSWRIVPRNQLDQNLGWTRFSPTTTIATSPLSPGEYHFQVRAMDADRNTETNPPSVTVSVLLPLWRRWEVVSSFFLTLAIAIAALVAGIRRQRLLRDSEKRYRTVVEGASDAIAMIQDGVYRYANPHFAELVGRPIEEILGTPLGTFAYPSDRERAVERYTKRMGGEPVPNQYETALLGRNGAKIDVEVRAAVVPFGEGLADLILFRDIRERKAALDRLIENSRMEATATMAAGVAHDFNNLMVGVLGYSEILKSDLPPKSDHAHMLNEISTSARKASDLAQQMLAYARGGKYQARLLDINEVAQNGFRLLRSSIPGRVKVRYQLDEGLPPFEGDPSQIGQVVMNLGSNAVESIEAEGEVFVSTSSLDVRESLPLDKKSTLTPGKYVVLDVTDTGCGMDEATKSRLFEPFFTTKFHGRGLGMAAVYGIIENHGGFISVSSELGKGTSFRVFFPASSRKPNPAPTPRKPPTSGGETVLVVEDEESVSSAEQRLLENLGYKVLLAPDGEAALELLATHKDPVHAVLLDLNMPGEGGQAVLPKIKQIRPDVRVIVCSGFAVDGTELIAAGASGILQKPFTIDALATELRRVLDARAPNI